MPQNLYLCNGFEALFILNEMKKFQLIFIPLLAILLLGCSSEEQKSNPLPSIDVSADPYRDAEIQKYNLDLRKGRSERFPCDTISVIEYVLDNYPPGTYLMETDKTTLESLPTPSVIYYDDKDGSKYIFAVIAKSRQGERLIETKNLIGYNESYIDLDSTKLGTAFLYLILLECRGNNLSLVWESIIPSHGGFKDHYLSTWNYNGTLYIQNKFYYAQGIGTIDYNYFLIDGIRSQPHLLMTYKGVDFKRTLANVNNDKYPDYYEHIYVSLEDRIFAKDSVAFIWNEKQGAYVNTRNARQTRLY